MRKTVNIHSKLLLREKLLGWWHGYRDSKKSTKILMSLDSQSTNMTKLIARRLAYMSLIDEIFRKEVEGKLSDIVNWNLAEVPKSSTNLGHEGRVWHNYKIVQERALGATDFLLNSSKRCQDHIRLQSDIAQAIIDGYVATVKRHHPRRDDLYEWQVSVFELPQWYAKIEMVTEKAIQIQDQMLANLQQINITGGKNEKSI
ncbi:MAG: hypothetical protein RIS09_226 [Actinomycetota bacterium]|jgi:hypothetical protein